MALTCMPTYGKLVTVMANKEPATIVSVRMTVSFRMALERMASKQCRSLSSQIVYLLKSCVPEQEIKEARDANGRSSD